MLSSYLSPYTENGELKIKDDTLIFSNKSRVKIEKLILSDGYEDPLFINFSDLGVELILPLDELVDEKMDSAMAAQRLSSLLDSLLSERYKLDKSEFAGTCIYRISTKGNLNFKSVRHGSGLSLLFPAFFVSFLGKRKTLVDNLN